jgi:hypothetical protein
MKVSTIRLGLGISGGFGGMMGVVLVGLVVVVVVIVVVVVGKGVEVVVLVVVVVVGVVEVGLVAVLVVVVVVEVVVVEVFVTVVVVLVGGNGMYGGNSTVNPLTSPYPTRLFSMLVAGYDATGQVEVLKLLSFRNAPGLVALAMVIVLCHSSPGTRRKLSLKTTTERFMLCGGSP